MGHHVLKPSDFSHQIGFNTSICLLLATCVPWLLSLVQSISWTFLISFFCLRFGFQQVWALIMVLFYLHGFILMILVKLVVQCIDNVTWLMKDERKRTIVLCPKLQVCYSSNQVEGNNSSLRKGIRWLMKLSKI